MSSTASAPIGVQTPRVRRVPPAASNEASDAIFLGRSYGLVPDPWQELVLEGWLGRSADGRWSSPRCGLAVPRQNGKNAVIELRELYGMVALGEKWLHTAHEVKTARKAFARLLSFFDNAKHFPELHALVEEIRRTNGQEAIVLRNGGSVEFVARTRGSGRGFTVDVLLCDEAQEETEEGLEALLPTISAAPLGNPQQIHTGTPPGPKAAGEVFARLRREGVEGGDGRLCWHEWSSPPGVDVDDQLEWFATNPALGIRLNLETLLDERATMSDEGYARERLGVWDLGASSSPIPAASWAAAADIGSAALDPVAFAVEVSPDRDWSAICVGGRREDDRLHGAIVEYRRGVEWVVPRLVELRDNWSPVAVALDPSSPAGGLLPALREAGVDVLEVNAREMGQACGLLFDAVAADGFRHRDEPALNVALQGARKVPIGDAWKWDRKRSTDISPLVAMTLAVWAQSNAAHSMPNIYFI